MEQMCKWAKCTSNSNKSFFKENAFGDLRPKLFFEVRIKIQIQIRADGRRIKKLEIYFWKVASHFLTFFSNFCSEPKVMKQFWLHKNIQRVKWREVSAKQVKGHGFGDL